MKLENVVNDKVFGSFSDSFEFLLRSFRTGDKQTKPLIFIMEEFDLFTKNKSQLLLYTILNTIQSSSSPMCLIGLSCRIDVLDLLEKRVKSRFSHRQIYLFNDYSFDKYMEMGKFFIENSGIESSESKSKSKYLSNYLDELFNDKDILKMLNRQFEYDKSMLTLKRILILPTIKLNELDKQALKDKNIDEVKVECIRSFNLLNMDAKFSLMMGLSVLELTLVVVMLEMSETYVGRRLFLFFSATFQDILRFWLKRGNDFIYNYFLWQIEDYGFLR